MFAGYKRSRGARRGVVLIVVLGMLGLLALIGVTFATFSAQARISARNFSMSQSFPDSRELMDFALSQLIDDTYNPVSAIRGHSLKRDMYGNDAAFNGYLAARPDNGAALRFTSVSASAVPNGPLAGLYACEINVQYNDPAFYGYYDFTRWIVQVPGQPVFNGTSWVCGVGESFEVIYDDYSGQNSNARVLYLTPHDGTTSITNYATPFVPPAPPPQTAITQSGLIGASVGAQFVLDGRYLRAFNGPGLSALVYPGGPGTVGVPANIYGNFRVNGGLLNTTIGAMNNPVPALAPMGDPNAVGMDEDYDACDLDNWFLAIQSADGQVVIPSFHRPAIIRADQTDGSNAPNNGNTTFGGATDWNITTADSMARILRPRTKDGHSALSFPDLLPDSNGRITYDVDNDGDGVTDSVWLDLGYPAKRDATGQLFKPLFSFLVIGLNGRLPLNTAGNIQLRDNESSATSYPPPQPVPPVPSFTPLYAHAGRLGYSPSEIDICYALQNGADINNYSQNDNSGAGVTPNNVIPNFNFAQNGIPVNLTQLRNILTGTRPQINPYVAPGSYPNNGLNQDTNFVAVNGQPFFMPNNVADAGDATAYGGNTGLIRATSDVAGRWGESDYVPGPGNNLIPPSANPSSPPPGQNILVAGYNFRSPIRAGLSLSYGDMEDDNFTQYDPTGRAIDTYDLAGGLLIPVERMRRFTTPLDVSGNGMLVTFNTGSAGVNGPDQYGRVGYYLYYRPKGYPTVSLPLLGANVASTAPPDKTTNPLHGFDAFYNPLLSSATSTSFNGLTSMGAADSQTGGVNQLGYNEADEMRLYTPNEYDQPFDVADLQWLYRSQDSDGASLTSRLAQLAPVSFLNPKDGIRRRRLFALDSWETTNFVWAPDNPGGAFPDNSRFGVFPNPNNQGAGNPVLLPYTANASFANLNLTPAVINTVQTNVPPIPYPFGYFSPLPPYGAQNNYAPANTAAAISPDPSPAWPARTPPLAHRDRKINLNYPLPVSNDPNEPVRQKWIANTYDLLKSILPPQSIDTPAECAKLSQFVINIIDFRDPDGTMTHWVNPDVHVIPATGGPGVLSPLAPQLVWASAGGQPFDQFGMEYQPIAINEVLAYSFLRKDLDPSVTTKPTAAAIPTNRFFVELVSTLTQSGSGPASGANTFDPTDAFASGNQTGPATAAAAGLDLTNWDLVIAEDDVLGRPDPTTGQLLSAASLGSATAANELYGPIPITPGSFVDFTKTTTGTKPMLPPATTTAQQPIQLPGLTNVVPAFPAAISGSSGAAPTPPPLWGPNAVAPNQYAFNYYFVIGNLLPIIPATNSPSPTDSTKPEFVGNGGKACENQPPSLTNTPPDQIETLMDGNSATTRNLPETDVFDSVFSISSSVTTANNFLSNSNIKPTTDASPAKNPLLVQNPTMYPVPQLNPNQRKYYWVYLRRPANPFAPSTGAIGPNPMVTVDSMRFAYIEGGGTVTQIDQGGYTNDMATAGANPIYSTQRMQPFRGGHAVSTSMQVYNPNPTSPGTLYTNAYDKSTGNVNMPGIIPAYGYSEQTAVPATASTNYGYFGIKPITPTTGIYHTLGKVNDSSENWDYFPFHDRDFMSVAELALVPGCPPGLFTKQFVENAPLNFSASTAPQVTPPPALPAVPDSASNPLVSNASPAVPHVYPYLVDNFFYTAGSPQVLNTVGNQANGTGPVWPKTGGPTGAGWHKMFEFFEVPTPAFGSIGPVAAGFNFDWARQDTRPGMLNLNLIIDEEVWLGLMGNAGLMNTIANLTTIPMLNSKQMGNVSPETGQAVQNQVPKVVTLTDTTGSPYQYSTNPNPVRLMTYPVSNVGFLTIDPLTNTTDNRMKAAFNDFLKLRHGGSGYMFAWGTGPVGNTPLLGGQHSPAAERPFRSLSFPDIDYTIMRPAALPPPPASPPWPYAVLPTPVATATPTPLQSPNSPGVGNFFWDPGVKDPYTVYAYTPASTNAGTDIYPVAPNPAMAGRPNCEPPNIPPRRLFQIPDAHGSNFNPTAPTPPFSNASFTGDGRNTYVLDPFLANPNFDLTSGPAVYLGASGITGPPPDNRQHPYYRTEWLQKIMNLTTVRTHQYAVWITIAFFQVSREGDPSLAADTNNFTGAYDILGDELNISTGRNTRYRSFFLLDRTRATGFNPGASGDFRNVVVYRQSIE